ncbi:hypothetical protein D3C75_1115560 [compost metagenome]
MVASPIGLRHSSPSVSIKILPTSHIGDTPAPAPLRTFCAASIIRPKPPAANKIPITNLVILPGRTFRRASAGQAQLKIGARIMINSALMDWNHTAGISKSPIMRLV